MSKAKGDRSHAGRPPVVGALYGPTSSGKTALSLQFAELFERTTGIPVEIISADSRQVYRYMDIGTSKVTPSQRALVRHHLIDVLEPIRKLSLHDYQRLAFKAIDEIVARGHLPFVVGGTGTYVQSILQGWVVEDLSADVDRLRTEFPKSEVAAAYRLLRRIDAESARRVHQSNWELVLTHLARALGGSSQGRKPDTARSYGGLLLGLDLPRSLLEARITSTLDSQLRLGLYEEVIALDARYGLSQEYRRRQSQARNQVLQTHGYREFFEVAHRTRTQLDRLSKRQLDVVRAEALGHILSYSARQRSWFRKMRPVRFVRDSKDILRAVRSRL
jgi:tRNA dimethylallyltransferase